MKSFFKLLEKTAGPIGFLAVTTTGILDFLAPLGNYIYILVVTLTGLTVLSVLCNKNNLLVEKIKSLTLFIPDFIKVEIAELWQPNDVVFWKKGLFQVLSFLTALSISAAIYAQNNPKGFLATKIESLANLQTSLGLISSQLTQISDKQDVIITSVGQANQKLDFAKKEISDNPRKELANLGVEWHEDNFWDAILVNDEKIINLFVSAKMELKDISFLSIYLVEVGDVSLLNKLVVNKLLDIKHLQNPLKLSAKVLVETNPITTNLSKNIAELENRNNQLLGSNEKPYLSSYDTKLTPLIIAIWMKNQDLVSYLKSQGVTSDPFKLEFVKSSTGEPNKFDISQTSLNFDYDFEASNNNINLRN